jgi:DNA-binding NarL/FixJ family response regulator
MSLGRVLIVDDHKPVTESLTQLLQGQFDVVGSVDDGSQLLDAVARLRPDVILLDLSMPNVGGFEALGHLKQSADPKVIVLTMHRDARLAMEALKSGACGFVLKESSVEELPLALEAALHGRTYLTSKLTNQVRSLMAAPAEPSRVRLTTQQREVLQLIVQGRRVKEIAVTLDVPPDSVESIKSQMMQVLNVHSTAELVKYATQHSLVTM